ncbi:phosphoglucosamine mutase [archaeon SCG-AAA382B04]|nr:phosphoglucosamine mutase [archaeon SCG-AAA382B04]
MVLTELFGTNGVRGIANDELTPELVMKLARSLATFLGDGRIAIARDTRVSGEMLKKAAITGTQSTGLDVVDIGEAPSPCLQYYVKENDFDSGIIITASHNPAEYNGVKFVDGDGVEYSHKQLEEMERIYKKEIFQYADWSNPGNHSYDDAIPMYIRAIKQKIDIESILEENPKVVVDPGNGAGCFVTPYLLRQLGCKVVTLNSQPDGLFPAREPEPLPKNIEDLADTVEAVGADLGVAHDGDADRATFVDEKGKPHMGDVSLVLFFKKMLKTKEGNKVVTPVSSGKKASKPVEELGGEVVWTEVGSTTVSRKMIELGDECVCGGEENGGVIFPDFQYCRDGALTAARMIELLSTTEKTLSELANELPQYKHVKTKTKVQDKQRIMKKVFKKIEGMGECTQTIDGAKIFWEDSWILIRPSGTEPVVRVFTEAPSLEEAKELARKGLEIVEETKEE